MGNAPLSPEFTFPPEFAAALRRMNPWWGGEAMPVLPATRRHLVGAVRRRLELGTAPVVALRGPRQIGKTTAQLHLIADLLEEGVAPLRILHVQFDDLVELTGFTDLVSPLLRVVEWFEHGVLGATLNGAAHDGRTAYLFLDEFQNLRGWETQLKFLVDHSTVNVVMTGSSALRIERGRDSLAGRITTLEGGVLSLAEIGEFAGLDLGASPLAGNGLDALADPEFWRGLREAGEALAPARDEAFRRFSERGGYPRAQVRYETPWPEMAEQLNETVVRRVIQHDSRLDERMRLDPELLEEVFRLACRYAGQSPSARLFLRETRRALGEEIGGAAAGIDAQRVRTYLGFLEDSLLVRLIQPIEMRMRRRRGDPKICLADHGLRASWLQEEIPLDPRRLRERPELTRFAGRIAESVTGAHLCGISGLQVAHLPAHDDEPEVDFVLTVGDRRIPLEVKYQARIDPLRDTDGLRAFLETRANNAPFGVLVTQTAVTVDDPRIVSLPLSSLLLLR